MRYWGQNSNIGILKGTQVDCQHCMFKVPWEEVHVKATYINNTYRTRTLTLWIYGRFHWPFFLLFRLSLFLLFFYSLLFSLSLLLFFPLLLHHQYSLVVLCFIVYIALFQKLTLYNWRLHQNPVTRQVGTFSPFNIKEIWGSCWLIGFSKATLLVTVRRARFPTSIPKFILFHHILWFEKDFAHKGPEILEPSIPR